MIHRGDLTGIRKYTQNEKFVWDISCFIWHRVDVQVLLASVLAVHENCLHKCADGRGFPLVKCPVQSDIPHYRV